MKKNSSYIDKVDKNKLKQKALEYMPRNLGDTEAQQQIIHMIVEVAPSVISCMNQADMQIWPKVANQELPIGNAIAQCAYQTDRIIAVTLLESLALETLSEETLLKAWIALDYYAYVLKAEYSTNIRNLQDHIADILIGKEKNRKLEDIGPTQPVLEPKDDSFIQPAQEPQNVSFSQSGQEQKDIGTTQVVQVPKNLNSIQPTQESNKSLQNKTTKPVHTSEISKGKKRGKKMLVIAALLVVAVMVLFALNKTWRSEIAIWQIGTVTLDSAEKIERAEHQVGNLTDKQKSKVDNLNKLLEAREEYNLLETQNAIDNIGKVTMESGEAIERAEQLYETLSRTKRNQLENYQILIAARKEYNRLTTAVQEAIKAIDAIGTVSPESGQKIDAAREAYDALKKDKLESYVSNKASILEKAEAAYAQCASEDLYNTGIALYEKGSYEEALEKFNAIVSDYPQTTLIDSAKDAMADCQMALAEKAHGRNEQYTAITLLNAVEKKYQNSEKYQKLLEKIHTRLKSNRPGSGTVIKGSLNWGQCYFDVTTADKDICLKIEKEEDPAKFKMVYLRAGETKRINVEDGVYTIKWAYGEYWYEKDHLFGDETQYKQMRGNVTFTTTYKGGWVYFWYNTLDMNNISNNSKSIQADDF